ncbi:MAG: heavy metal-associated domain-containing protein [Acidobacteriota bacterium]
MKKALFLLLAIAAAWPLSAATRTATFAVKGWTCGSCAASTRIALKKLEGVESVKTDTEKMEATVTYDDAKIAPQKMVQAIEKLGYKATVKATLASSPGFLDSDKVAAVNAPQSPERVSFFEVPLECGAAADLGCGSASKPVLKAVEKDSRVHEAKINHAGTVLAVIWIDPEQSRSGAASVEAAFKTRDLESTLLRGPARDKALKEYGSGRWYGSADVDKLSEREAQVIATRLVNRAKTRLNLPPEKLAALTRDLSGGIATILTRDKGEECARDPFEELSKVASKQLNPQQLAELRKAAEQGAGALPGEVK